ncbi:MAG: peptidase M16 [Gammaproteobacteria bacterium]|nr:MAG: peptidase M16 [Gammaproteobacteria bacterium]
MFLLKSFTTLIVSGFLLVACSSQQVNNLMPNLPDSITFIEQVKVQANNITIPYKKYRLKNGLTVILHQDHSDPLVHVDVTYHVGSAREQLGKSGLAHFFEHMMFQGSEHVADEQHFKIVTESGGNLNGTTNTDRTNYYETVPNNQLEKMLWLESDRMGYLLTAITKEKFEVQRATVKNERGQNVDDRPYGRIGETINQMLYPRSHPYSWPTIGFMDDLDRVSLTDLKQFFTHWYGPNNAVLTIGGDFNEQQALTWIAKYFSDIKTGSQVKNFPKKVVNLAENKYLTLIDNISLPLLYISFPTVYALHKDEAALDVLANILGNGSTSLFYQSMVKLGLAVQAAATHPCKELACTMNFYAIANPQQGISLVKLQTAINNTLVDFERRGVKDDDLLKTKVSMETETIYSLQSVAGKVSSLSFFETFTGDANFTQQQLARYQKVTKADVMRVYNKYIKNKAAAILSVVPRGLSAKQQAKIVAHQDDFVLPDISHPPQVKNSDLSIVENKSSFDRNIIPPSGRNPLIKVPSLWRKNFANGLKIIGSKNTETPTISLLLSIEGGPLLDPINKAGLASLTAALMEEGTTNYLKEELSNELAKLGSNISVAASGRNTYIQVSSLTKNLDATINLMLDVMFNPAFKQADFDRVKNQLLQGLQQGLKDPNTIAARARKQLLFGTNNRIGLVDSGSIKTVSAITLNDVKQFYKNYFSPKYSNLVIVGAIDKSNVLAKFDYLKHWQGANYSIPSYKKFPQLDANTIIFIDQPKVKQANIALVRRAMPFDALGDYFKANLMNYPLGGAFNSRINLNLREDKGYTYGANSGFSGGKTLGSFSARASVKQAHTIEAMLEIEKEIETFKINGMTPAEADFMRKAISQNEALSYETPRQKSGFLRQLIEYGLSDNYGEQQTDIINTISLQALNNIAKDELSKPLQWIVVGDAQVVKPQLEKLNRPIVEMKLTP